MNTHLFVGKRILVGLTYLMPPFHVYSGLVNFSLGNGAGISLGIAGGPLIVALLLAGCARERLHQQESYVFGTRVELLTWDASDAKAESAMAEVLREFDRLHRAYHAWEPSELTALNTAIAAGQSEDRKSVV